MKKSIFFVAAGAIALTACTSEEVRYEGTRNAIGFENVVRNASRAEDEVVDQYAGKVLTADLLDKFCVFGYYTNPEKPDQAIPVFVNQLVTKNTVNSQVSWTYDIPRYWVPGGTYYFYAYSCGDVKLSDTFGSFAMNFNGEKVNDRVLTITNYRCDNNHQHDLLYATNEGITPKQVSEEQATNDPVAFEFNHILAKIDAQFKSDFTPDYEVVISDVKISNICNVGSYKQSAQRAQTGINGWYGQVRKSNDDTTDPYVMLLEGDKTLTARRGGKPTTLDPEAAELPTLEPLSDFAFVLPYDYDRSGEGEDGNTSTVTVSFTAKIMKDGELVLSREMKGTWSPTWAQGFQYTYTFTITGSAANLDVIVFTTSKNTVNGFTDGVAQEIKFSSDNSSQPTPAE